MWPGWRGCPETCPPWPGASGCSLKRPCPVWRRCGGLEPAEVAALLARAGARGVDRVVPLGQALEMDTVWDGRDLIAALSRIIG